eukprot:scaffold13285_cov36-Cyclotella_meneghiniana.AAC.1
MPMPMRHTAGSIPNSYHLPTDLLPNLEDERRNSHIGSTRQFHYYDLQDFVCEVTSCTGSLQLCTSAD